MINDNTILWGTCLGYVSAGVHNTPGLGLSRRLGPGECLLLLLLLMVHCPGNNG